MPDAASRASAARERRRRRARRGARLTVALAAAAALLGAATAAGSQPMLPAGTPYAAEVRMNVTATISEKMEWSQTTPDSCGSQAQVTTQTDTFKLHWYADYPQVTVPVATAEDLGHAYTKLHVPTQATSPGKGGLDPFNASTYDIEGSGPSAGDLCDQKPYFGVGRFVSAPGFTPDFAFRANQSGAFDSLFIVGGGDALTAEPPTYDDSTGVATSVLDELEDATQQLPSVIMTGASSTVDWDSVVLDSSVDGRLRELIHKPYISLNVERTAYGEKCPETKGQYDTCTLTYVIEYNVFLTKLALYTSRHAYPR